MARRLVKRGHGVEWLSTHPTKLRTYAPVESLCRALEELPGDLVDPGSFEWTEYWNRQKSVVTGLFK